METKVALVSIILENYNKIDEFNSILHEFNEYIIGRMGVPYRKKGISVISVAIDAPMDTINALSGKLGRLDGISAKTLIASA